METATLVKSYPNTKNLEFYADYVTKLDSICENLPDFAITLDPVEKMLDAVSMAKANLLISVAVHPAWEWCLQIPGNNQVTMAKILGHLRFWPPESNEIKQSTEKPRWAHSRAAALMFCGFGTFEDYDIKRSSKDHNSRLKSLIYDQVKKFVISESKYRSFYESEKTKFLNQIANEDAHAAALKSTAMLFINHLWEVTRTDVGLEIYPIYENLRPNEEFINPMNMIQN